MGLIKPIPTGASMPKKDSLQHEAAMRIQNRIDRDERREQKLEKSKRFKSMLSLGVLMVVFCGGLWLWHTGAFDSLGVNGRNTAIAEFGNTVVDCVKNWLTFSSSGDGNGLSDNGGKNEKGKKAVNRLELVEATIKGAVIDYWKNVPAEFRPVKGKPAIGFIGIVPNGNGGGVFFELTAEGGKALSAKKIMAKGVVEAKEEFNKLIAKYPYLVVKDGCAYFSPATKVEKNRVWKVPAKGSSFNPARSEFGELYGLLPNLKLAKPSFKYEVSVAFEKYNKVLPVAKVNFGEDVSYDAFMKAARKLVDETESAGILLSGAVVHLKPVKLVSISPVGGK